MLSRTNAIAIGAAIVALSCRRAATSEVVKSLPAIKSGTRVVQITGSLWSTCARLADATVRCWGNNEHGQLGDGTRTSRSVPVAVVGIEGAVELASADSYTCARLERGNVRCWGRNDWARVIAPARGAVTVPLDIPDVQDASELALDGDELCVLRAHKPARWWCTRPPNELHDGPRFPLVERVDLAIGAASPLTVRADRTWRDAGPQCEITAEHHVKCHDVRWEAVSDGESTRIESVVDIEGIDRAVAIADSGSNACALLEDGEVMCWGDGKYGQLGDGRKVDPCIRGRFREPPVRVATRVRFDVAPRASDDDATYAPPTVALAPHDSFMPADAPDLCRAALHSNQRFAELFTKLREPSLWIAAADRTLRAYRFTLDPTWAEPISVRVESRGAGARLTVSRLSGAGGFGRGPIDLLETRALSEAEWTSVESCVTAATKVEPYDRTLGADGSEWLFESARDGRYAARMRWSPRGEDANDPPMHAFVACAETMVTLAGLDPKRMEAKGVGP